MKMLKPKLFAIFLISALFVGFFSALPFSGLMRVVYASGQNPIIFITGTTTPFSSSWEPLEALFSLSSSVTCGFGETFVDNATGSYKLMEASFCLQKMGSPTGNATVVLYAMAGTYGSTGQPTGSALATSNNFNVASLTTSGAWYNFTFSSSNQYVMTSSTDYCIAFQNPTSGTISSSNYVQIDKSASYSGNSFTCGYGSWSYWGSSPDASFKIYGAIPLDLHAILVNLVQPSKIVYEPLQQASFPFNVTTISTIKNASLWMGSPSLSWQRVANNQTKVSNVTTNTITYTLPSSGGTFTWNVEVYNSTKGVFASSNSTIFVIPKSSVTYITKLFFNNLTAQQVNASFPFVYTGADTNHTQPTDAEQIDCIIGAIENGNATLSTRAQAVASWLNSTSNLWYFWCDYNTTSKQWLTTNIQATTASEFITSLATLADALSIWKPLLQKVVNRFLSDFLNYSTYRLYGYITEGNPPTNKLNYENIDETNAAIPMLTFCSYVLGNNTLKNIAYRVAMNYTLGTIRLPYETIFNNGSDLQGSEYYDQVKEDEGVGDYLLALEAFNYYYPTNTTINFLIANVSSATNTYVWNPSGYWDYIINCTSGASIGYYPIHGFGLLDEAMLYAGLLFNKTQYISHAEQDFTYNVINSALMSPLYLIRHVGISEEYYNQSEDAWNVYNRRVAIELYTYTHNSTYLTWSDYLFYAWQYYSQRKNGYQGNINAVTGADWDGDSRITWTGFLTFVNNTAATTTTAASIFTSFGNPYILIMQPSIIRNITITSTPTTGVSFALNGISHSTSYLIQEFNGTQVNIVFSQTITYQSTTYTFDGWTGTSLTGRNITCSVTSTTTLTAIYALPLSTSISPTSATIDHGQSQTFTSSISSGTSPYTYQWYLNSAPVSGAMSSLWTFTPGSNGFYSVYVNVTDNAGFRAESNTASVVVFATLSASISPGSRAMYAGQFQQFTANITGGMASYSLQWYLNGSAVSGATSPTWTFTPSSAGSYTVYVEVTDNLGILAASNTANVTVNTYTGQLFHDVAVTNVTSSKNAYVEGDDITVNITVKNEGNYTETFNETLYGKTLYGNAWPIYTFTGVTLAPGSMTTLTIGLGFGTGFYTLSAYAWTVAGETHTSDNTYTGPTVLVAPCPFIGRCLYRLPFPM